MYAGMTFQAFARPAGDSAEACGRIAQGCCCLVDCAVAACREYGMESTPDGLAGQTCRIAVACGICYVAVPPGVAESRQGVLGET